MELMGKSTVWIDTNRHCQCKLCKVVQNAILCLFKFTTDHEPLWPQRALTTHVHLQGVYVAQGPKVTDNYTYAGRIMWNLVGNNFNSLEGYNKIKSYLGNFCFQMYPRVIWLNMKSTSCITYLPNKLPRTDSCNFAFVSATTQLSILSTTATLHLDASRVMLCTWTTYVCTLTSPHPGFT